jgi:sigma-B regulation protein RsbU (phosphoserine phosphatase)
MLGRAGQPWQPLEAGGAQGPTNLPLGILPGARFTQEQVRLEPGDRLFAYTDGVAECPGPGEELYGDERMLEKLNQTSGQPLTEVRRAIREDLVKYSGGALVHDDVTFLLIEALEPPPLWKRRIFAGKPRKTTP